MTDASAFPLAWPAGWPRTSSRRRARFGQHSVAGATRFLLLELGRMGVGDWNTVISTNVRLRLDGLPLSNQAAPADPGAAVYFKRAENRGTIIRPYVLACDAWDRVEHNLHAIAMHVEALRGIDRWGVGSLEKAFTGYLALPAGGESGAVPRWTVLGLSGGPATYADARRAYSEAAKRTHPDHGGDAAAFQRVARAWDQAHAELGP